MNKAYIFAGLIGLLIAPYLKHSPFSLAKTQTLKEGNTTYYIVPEMELTKFQEDHQTQLITVDALLATSEVVEGLLWGQNTETIQSRVHQLREESSMFNQILVHLEESGYPYSITNTNRAYAYGSYSSKKGEVQFGVDKMHDFFFDATIIEEFVHAYQALYYNYTHGTFRTELQKKAISQGKDYSKTRKEGLLNWKKYGRKHAFIESEAKLMTYFIQHQTCTISVQDIVDTDDYNTGGKGRKIIRKYLDKKRCFVTPSSLKRLGHLAYYWIDLPTFALYQQRFMRHWRRKAPGSNYTLGYFHHKPEALNNVFQPIKSSVSVIVQSTTPQP